MPRWAMTVLRDLEGGVFLQFSLLSLCVLIVLSLSSALVVDSCTAAGDEVNLVCVSDAAQQAAG